MSKLQILIEAVERGPSLKAVRRVAAELRADRRRRVTPAAREVILRMRRADASTEEIRNALLERKGLLLSGPTIRKVIREGAAKQ